LKIIRYFDIQNDSTSFGIISSDKICPIIGSPFSKNIKIEEDQEIPYNPEVVLVPCLPTKVVALAINYEGATGQSKDMKEPLVFLKSTNSVVGFNDKIRLPFKSNTWGESELGIVIRLETTSKVSSKNIKDYILGYLPANDISCDNIEKRDHHLARSKSADGFCPIGSYIDTNYKFNNKKITAYHNDELIRSGNTDQMIWNPHKIIIWLSSWMTLYPGDIVLTGTPPRVIDRKFLMNGDSFTVKIEGFPSLTSKFYEI
jgi:2-keto-4-pentenoate hydratase/2-oxohepta-3-ene-1,7-dioic acid hydratase in catechol pathway